MADNSGQITSTLTFKTPNSQGVYTNMPMIIVHEGEYKTPIDITIYTQSNPEIKQISWSAFKETYLNTNQSITITQPGRDSISGLVSGSAGGKRRTRTKKNKRKNKKSRKNKN